jgi:hypothetical protein
MIYRCTIETYEIPDGCIKILPSYKSLNDNLTDVINWIREKAAEMNGFHEIACEHIWDLYYDEFIDKKILSKHDFYKLIREKLQVKMKIVRINTEAVKRCFVTKSSFS